MSQQWIQHLDIDHEQTTDFRGVEPGGLEFKKILRWPEQDCSGNCLKAWCFRNWKASKHSCSSPRKIFNGPCNLDAGSTRRSSVYGKGGGLKTDPRPVTDKAYQQSCVRTIITYLTSHGYENSISPKQLSSPTTKDFHSVIAFLFRQVEPGYRWVGKVEDEVPAMFKRLHYPLSISKTALVAVGSPHSWPALLAATAWLVELLNYHERATADQSASDLDEKDHQEGDREFFEYVSTSYRYFLSGDDDACAEVDAETEQKFNQKEQEASQDIDRIRKANEDLQRQLDELQNGPQPKQLLSQKKQDFISDIEKFKQLIATLEQHKIALQKKNTEREADLVAKRKEMATVEKESEVIRHRISSQPINREDILRMNNDSAENAFPCHTLKDRSCKRFLRP
eukprot:scaffold261935_cov46-Prasinocladus_malaysianus.AAC.1